MGDAQLLGGFRLPDPYPLLPLPERRMQEIGSDLAILNEYALVYVRSENNELGFMTERRSKYCLRAAI